MNAFSCHSRLFQSRGTVVAGAAVACGLMVLTACAGSTSGSSSSAGSEPVIRGNATSCATFYDYDWTVTADQRGATRVVTFDAPENASGWKKFEIEQWGGGGWVGLNSTTGSGTATFTGRVPAANIRWTVTGTDAQGCTDSYTTPAYAGVTYSGNGGSGTMSEQLATTFESSGTSITLNPNQFTREGFGFLGWSTSQSGLKAAEDGGPWTLTGDVKLYALWASVLFDANDGSGRTQRQAATTSVKLTSKPFARTGYTFDGWANTSTGTVAFGDGFTYDFAAIPAPGSKTMYAKWSCLPLGSWTVSGRRVSADRAEVTFTAPASASPWSTFTATSTDAGKTATVSQSNASGVITVSGLSKHTGYRFTVTGRNEAGCTYVSQETDRVEQWNKH